MNLPNTYEIELTGSFRVDNRQFMGKLIHNRQTGKVLLYFDKNIYNKKSAKRFEVLKFPKKEFIQGKLSDGRSVKLYNVQCLTLGLEYCSNILFSVEYILFSKNKINEEKYNELRCEVENALGWSKLSHRNIDFDFNVQYLTQDNPRQFELFGAKISFSIIRNRDIWNGIPEESYKIDEHLIFSIFSETKQSINYFIDIRNKLLSLISFAVCNNVNILQQQLSIYNEFPLCNVELITNEPYRPIDIENSIKFKMDELPEDKELDKKITKLSPIFDLYLLQIKNRNIPLEIIFSNLIQGVEALHAIFLCQENKSKSDYIDRIKKQYPSLLTNKAYQRMLLSDERQLKDDINFVCLYSRLNELLFDNESKIFAKFYADCKYDNTFVCDIVKTRNYYTHYDASYFKSILKGDELKKAIKLLRILLEYHICKILGVDIQSIIESELQQL